MDLDEYENLPTNNFSVHMTAGAIAGVMEHCVMYPLDSVKTRMQSLSPSVRYNSITDAVKVVVRQEGIFRLVRGMSAVIAGAGPAHALYFSCYEHLKEKFQDERHERPFFLVAGLSGGIATLLHDAVMNPAEVVKQRLQMYNSPYNSIFDCAKKTYYSEGMRAFYRSYTTQLTMNIPFQSIHFITYEACQNVMNKDKIYNPVAHMLSGAVAGAVAAAVTTPLDVVKTLLNTQQLRVKGMIAAFRTVYKIGGVSGYFRGIKARIIYQMPSTAICWSVYELFKYLLSRQVMDVRFIDKSLAQKFNESDVVAAAGHGSGMMPDESDIYKRDINSVWGEGLGSEPSGMESKKRSLIDGNERTYAEKAPWKSAVLSNPQVLGTLNLSASIQGVNCRTGDNFCGGDRS